MRRRKTTGTSTSKREALEALEKIRGTPMNSNGDPESTDSGLVPRIDDEHMIENHAGSMLPHTQRKKLERMAGLSLELGMRDEAVALYRELLMAFPDQWTYCLGLFDACVKSSSCSRGASVIEGTSIDEEGWKSCRAFAKVLSAAEGDQKHALRGPRLILVELASMKACNGEEAVDVSSVAALCGEIWDYGNRFGPEASCCSADLRLYFSVLVREASSHSLAAGGASDILEDVSLILQRTKESWSTNYQTNGREDGEGEVSADQFRERRKRLRTYIFAVQVIYAVAAELRDFTSQLPETYAPSVAEMATQSKDRIHKWTSTGVLRKVGCVESWVADSSAASIC